MTTLKEVTQESLDDVDRRLEKAMKRLTETTLQVKAERDKYAAVLHRIKRGLEPAGKMRQMSRAMIWKIVDEVLGE